MSLPPFPIKLDKPTFMSQPINNNSPIVNINEVINLVLSCLKIIVEIIESIKFITRLMK